MAKLGRGGARRLVLDIGANTIRVCQLASTKTGYRLVKYMQREVLDDPDLEDDEKQAKRIEALREMLAEGKIRAKKTIFAVPGRSVFTRTRALPPVPEHKVTQIVRYEIQQQIPFSLDQIALDYQVLERTEAGGYEVLMAAIKVDVVEKELDILCNVKRSVDVVDVAPLAADNWIKHVGQLEQQGDCVAVMDMGASTTDIIIERDNQLRFTRSLSIGGNDVTGAISKEFGLGFADAEQLKKQRGFAPTGDPKRDGKGGAVIGSVLSRLIGEINRSFGYFRSLPGGGVVSRVVVTGGMAGMRNLVPYLQRELGMPVKIVKPFEGIEIAPEAETAKQFPHQACVALGLALRVHETVPVEINLVPPRVREIARRKEQAFYWVLVVATIALIVASIIPVEANKNKNVKQRIDKLKEFISWYDPELLQNPVAPSRYAGQLREAKAIVQRRMKQVEMLDNTARGAQFWVNWISYLNELRPPGNKVWFSSLETSVIEPPPKPDKPLESSGFTGIEPELAGRAGGGFGAPLMNPASRSKPPPQPNGLRLIGYANDPASLTQFIDNIRNSQYISEENVFFDEASVQMVPMTELDNARLSHRTAAMSVSRAGGGRIGPPGGFGPAGGSRGGPQPGMQPRPAAPPTDRREDLVTFCVDIKLGG